MNRRWVAIVGAAAVVASTLAVGVATPAMAGPCDPGGNPIVCENSKPGSPESEWEVAGAGDPGLQGFATKMSLSAGEQQQFKIKTSGSGYTIDIYRLGWYGGDGARKIGSATPTARTQPNCMTDPPTGLVDCGNWAVSASWTVPADAVSGVYIAHLNNATNQDESQIPFVVRNDASHSDILFQTSDSTWQAYNTYGGSDFYTGVPDGRAYKISYNRPFVTRGDQEGRDYLFANEYPMLQFMERNGYDVSYMSSLDVDRRGPLLQNHKVFVSTGHDEYWSGAQRANVEAARDAGVNLAFFSGNEVYWRTRWEPSIDGTSTDGRTLVCYKETWANAKIDPTPESTGTWRDPRFAPPSQGGGKPENALTGTIYMSNFTDLPITVSEREGKLRVWRNTSLGSMSSGQTTALAAHTIGYESDEDLDNGSRPPGLVRLSTTTGPTPQYLQDYGNTVLPGTTTHHLTLYRAASGALVFGAGTVQWAWGLSQNHDGNGAAADVRIQQATVNILADMGALASTIMTGLTASTKTTDTTAPTVTISAPADGAAIGNGSVVNVAGTATDVGGKVAGVEVSTDNGTTWHPATGTTSWTYSYVATGRGAATVKARAIDDSANIGTAASRSVTVSCPCSLFGESVPATPSANDSSSVELGVRFTPTEDGYVSGVRFYKGTGNTGTHTGSLWTASGALLATGTFTGETANGWQTLQFGESISVAAGTTYVASYRAPNGHYAADSNFFTAKDHVASPLTALGKPSGQTNGVYSVGSGFPTSSYGDTNYYVDVVFTVDDTTPPIVTSRTPLPGSSSVAPSVKPRAVFSRAIDPTSLQFTVTSAGGPVSGSAAYDAATRTATFTPTANLAYSTAHTVTVQASTVYGVPMDAPATWTFTTSATDPLPGDCPCSIWPDSATPTVFTDSDPRSVELGARFTAEADGEIVGVRFYKGPANVGTHTGSLWTASGQLLASVTFVGETSTGWQNAYFSSPVSIQADTTYVVSYRAPAGSYSYTANGLAAAVDSPPLHTVAHGGLYTFGAGVPTNQADTNYWVDVLYNPTDAAPTVSSVTPGAGATNVSPNAAVKASFAGQVRTGSAALAVKTSGGVTVAGSTSYNATTKTITFVPTSALTAGQSYQATASGAAALSGLTMAPFSWTFTVAGASSCPCTLFESTATPPVADANDAGAVTVGVKFAATVPGYVTGLRFYKSAANTGTHVGSLWSSAGAKLATVTFTGETATGWQTAQFAQPVQLTVGDTYVVSYRAPSGHYAATQQFFANPWDNVVLTAPAGANGVYAYGASESFPSSSYASSNYWVDPIFASGAAPDTTAPTGVASPIDGASSVSDAVTPSVTFSEGIDVATLQLSLKTSGGQTVAGSTAYDSGTRTATFTPGAALSRAATYTATVAAADPSGNAMTPLTWSFTTAKPDATPGVCPCSIWNDSAVPGMITVNDPANVELGVKFSADAAGTVTGVRFYKGPQNTGNHTGSLWDTAGNRLATATFTGESSTGWQTVSFATPVSLTAGTTYIASYSSSGYYSATVGGLTTALDQPPLHTPAGAGLYLYGSGFPTNTSSANYWVDVVFATGGTPPPADTTAPVISAVQHSAGANGSTATVTWTSDESATSVVEYGTTTALGSTATGPSGTNHSVSLSGLTSATTYYYRVTSVDAASNSATSPAVSGGPATFATPDVTAPAVSAVAAAVTGTSATVTWTTDESATTKVDYGTTTSLGSTATGATGTSHSVPLTGLAAGTYYYRVTSADAAANSTTDPVTASAPRTFVIADTTAPTISAVASTGSGTTATVTWTTNESATTSVSYGTTTSLGTTSTGTAGTSHSVTLTGLTVNTRYYFRVTSADAAGNSATSPAAPAAPASYVPTVAPITHSTVTDFAPGTGAYESDTAGGEVIGTPTQGVEFAGTTLPSTWTSTALVTGGTTTVTNGLATVSGARFRTNSTWSSGRSFTAAATLGAGQTLGWGSIATGSTGVTASFVMDAAGALSARVNDGGANNQTIAIPGTWTGASHAYEVDWSAGNAVLLIDGTQVATSAFSPTVNLRVMVVDPTTAAPALMTDWVRVGPFSAASTYTSAVVDAGAVVGWDTLTRDVSVPTGSGLTIQVRSGTTATPGTGWTGWSTVSATTNSITRSSRYLQYRLQFTSSGTRFTTPTVNSVQLAYHVL